MALSKAKQTVLNQFAVVLENLDDKNPLDQNILKAAHSLFKALVDASAAQGEEMEAAVEDDIEIDGDNEESEAEIEGDGDEVSFDEDETEAESDEVEADGEEAEIEGDDEVSFEEDEEATAEDDVSFEDEAPAKPSRKPAAAAPAPVEEEAVDYDGMKAQDLYNHLKDRGVDAAYAKKIFTTSKKEGLVKLANNIDKLKAVWLKNAVFKKPVETIEKFLTTKQGLELPGYGRGRSNDDKKKGILAEALAVAMKKPAA